jgi:hypothetical protein
VGFYDAPEPDAFSPLVSPPAGSHVCIFAYFKPWGEGKTLHITQENFGCGGAARALCGVMSRPREAFVKFLADEEGLKASRSLMEQWLDHDTPYEQKHDHLLIGPLRESQYEYLRSVTFYVNPDQLSLLTLGAQYRSRPGDSAPVLAPFGSGCMQLVTLFADLGTPQAVIGATDIAMRRFVPPDIVAFTVTKPLYEQLCDLDKNSFLHKPFWKRLRNARRSGPGHTA